MSAIPKPDVRPSCPNFSSGPCAKRPGWSPAVLERALVGRSHRSAPGKARLQEAIDRMRALLQLPEDYYLGIVPGSDTGAMEMAMWSLLGARGVDVFAWESFSSGWAADIEKHLKLEDVRTFSADYGKIPDLSAADGSRDIVFVWNGTTSGVCVPDADWIPENRSGLTFCDATSAVFAMEMDWEKLDVATFSWQKALGGEAAHGVLILSPRAVERLESYTPPWPLPKVFRMTKGGKFNAGIFKGNTINTPSMLCVEDVIDSLKWGEKMGGLPAMIARSRGNLEALTAWVEKTPWIDFLVSDPAIRSNTSICLKITAPWCVKLEEAERQKVAQRMVTLLDAEDVARDIKFYRDAPAGLRIWGGTTVETSDIEALCPWLEWAYETVRVEYEGKV